MDVIALPDDLWLCIADYAFDGAMGSARRLRDTCRRLRAALWGAYDGPWVTDWCTGRPGSPGTCRWMLLDGRTQPSVPPMTPLTWFALVTSLHGLILRVPREATRGHSFAQVRWALSHVWLHPPATLTHIRIELPDQYTLDPMLEDFEWHGQLPPSLRHVVFEVDGPLDAERKERLHAMVRSKATTFGGPHLRVITHLQPLSAVNPLFLFGWSSRTSRDNHQRRNSGASK